MPSKPFTSFGFGLPNYTCLVFDRKCFMHVLFSPSLPLRSFNNRDIWLHRHDRESRYLYGVLPLIEGMPVAMADHIDRSADKRIRFITSYFSSAAFSMHFMTPFLLIASQSLISH